MATVKKSALPLKPSTNPKIASVAQKTVVSKTLSSATVKKTTSVVAKITSEKVTPVKPATTLKSTSKVSAISASPVKSTGKSSVASNATKITAPVRSAADSTTSTLKSKPSAIKSSIKAPASPVKPVSSTKSVTAKPISKVVKPSSISSEPKKAPVTTVKSAGLLKPKNTEKSIVSKANPLNVTKTSTLKPSAVSTPPVSPRTSVTTSRTKTTIANKIPATTTKTSSIKRTSQPLPKSPAKSLIAPKTPSKSPTAVKPTKKVAAPTSKNIRIHPSVAVADVIKRLQDESEIEIRDADSTTTTVEEERNDVYLPTDADSMKLCKCDENGTLKQQETEVDEERVYAVAEQLIGVMQPEDLEVITRNVAEQQNNDSCVIDMSAVETEELLNEKMTDPVDIENIEDCYLSTEIQTETENRASVDEQDIFEMYETKIQEITDSYRCLNDETIAAEDVVAEETRLESAEGPEEERSEDCKSVNVVENVQFSDTVANESDEIADEEWRTESSFGLSSPSITVDNVNELQESTPFSLLNTTEDLTEMVAANETESTCTGEALLNDVVETEYIAEDTHVQVAEVIEESAEVNDTTSETENVAEENHVRVAEGIEESNETTNEDTENQVDSKIEISQPAANIADISNENFETHVDDLSELVEANRNLILTETDEHSFLDVPALINLESDVDDMGDNDVTTSCFDVSFPSTDDVFVKPETEIVDDQNENDPLDVEGENSEVPDVDSMTDMSYAEVLQSAKISTSDSQENIVDEECQQSLENVADDSVPSVETDKTSDPTPEITSDTVVSRPIPIYSVYDNTEFPDAIPSDEHYEKQEHDHEADQHDESFHKIRHKRNKRRNKKNRKSSIITENCDEQTAPKNVNSERPNYQPNYHGKRRNSRRGWKNSRSYYEAFHQHQPNQNQEYYADPHWKYTPRMD